MNVQAKIDPVAAILADQVHRERCNAHTYYNRLIEALEKRRDAHQVAHPDTTFEQAEQAAEAITDIMHHTGELFEYLSSDADAYHTLNHSRLNDVVPDFLDNIKDIKFTVADIKYYAKGGE